VAARRALVERADVSVRGRAQGGNVGSKEDLIYAVRKGRWVAPVPGGSYSPCRVLSLNGLIENARNLEPGIVSFAPFVVGRDVDLTIDDVVDEPTDGAVHGELDVAADAIGQLLPSTETKLSVRKSGQFRGQEVAVLGMERKADGYVLVEFEHSDCRPGIEV
jgi:hypothetical protein